MKLKSQTGILTFYFLVFTLFSCAPKDAGFLTMVNSNIDTTKISVDGRSFTIRPSNHITKELARGQHEIRIEGGPPVAAQVLHDKTTVFDSTGLSCFVVADYTQRYQGGNPIIVEKFKQQRVFTTSDKMITFIGSYLPKKLKENEKALRLQQIDCEIIDDNAELVNAIVNLQ